MKFSLGVLSRLYDAASRVHELNHTQGVSDETYERACEELDEALGGVDEMDRWAKEHAPAIRQARNIYTNDDIEIDDNPFVSPSDDGCWVSAWVWVSKEEAA